MASMTSGLLTSFATFFATIGPIEAAVMFAALTPNLPRSDRTRLAAKATADIEIPMDPAIGFGMTPDEQLVLGRYFSGRALIEIPTHRAKRQVVLQRIALEFDIGRRYSEPEVNEILGSFNPDWSTLRRGLIDEHLLDRETSGGNNSYWRSGGRITDLPPA